MINFDTFIDREKNLVYKDWLEVAKSKTKDDATTMSFPKAYLKYMDLEFRQKYAGYLDWIKLSRYNENMGNPHILRKLEPYIVKRAVLLNPYSSSLPNDFKEFYFHFQANRERLLAKKASQESAIRANFTAALAAVES